MPRTRPACARPCDSSHRLAIAAVPIIALTGLLGTVAHAAAMVFDDEFEFDADDRRCSRCAGDHRVRRRMRRRRRFVILLGAAAAPVHAAALSDAYRFGPSLTDADADRSSISDADTARSSDSDADRSSISDADTDRSSDSDAHSGTADAHAH